MMNFMAKSCRVVAQMKGEEHWSSAANLSSWAQDVRAFKDGEYQMIFPWIFHRNKYEVIYVFPH